MTECEAVATLKLKVSNRESGLLEWRPCACSITNHFQLVLQPSLSTDSDDDDDVHAAAEKVSPVIAIDLATQLRHIEQKKKNKARCEIVYTSESSGRSSKELMASSVKICQQWVERVREAQQSAQRQASIRQGAALANTRAASVSPLPRDEGSASDRGSQGPGEQVSTRDVHESALQSSAASSGVNSGADVSVNGLTSVENDGRTVSRDPFEANSSTKVLVSSAASNSSMSSSTISFALPPALKSQLNAGTKGRRRHHHRQRIESDSGIESIHSSLQASNAAASSFKPALHKRVDLSASALSSYSSSSSSSESSVMDASYSARFLPSRNKLSRFGPCRNHRGDSEDYRYAGDNNDEDDEDDDELSRLSPRSRACVAAALRRQRVRLEQRQLERNREVVNHHFPHHRRQQPHDLTVSSRHDQPSRRRREIVATPVPSRSASIGSGLMDSLDVVHVSSIARDEEDRCSNQDELDPRRHRAEADDSSSRQELRMLLRVEEALRHLEHENAQCKQREEALAAQVQALKDALRVKSAEREHVAGEFRAALHDKEKWQQAAQNAERMAGQLREELAIAREEAQLLAHDKLRLKRQNGELLAQVHRLDSLVYGRF